MTGRETIAGPGANGGRQDREAGSGASGDQVVSITPYLALARELSALYVPVQMRPEFAVALDAEIRAVARERYAEDFFRSAVGENQHRYRDRVMGYLQPVSDRMDRRVVLGAAALGSAAAVSVSIAGLLAYAWRQRGRRAA
jgi:hypothetical protein